MEGGTALLIALVSAAVTLLAAGLLANREDRHRFTADKRALYEAAMNAATSDDGNTATTAKKKRTAPATEAAAAASVETSPEAVATESTDAS